METGGGSFGRGQSEVLGIVLLFAIVLAVMGTVVFVGGQAINDAKSETSSASATLTMEELQSKAVESGSTGSAERVSFAQTGGGSEDASGSSVDAADRSARIHESDSISIDDSAGHLTVTVTKGSTGATHPVVDEDLGKILYEDDQEVIYQGGVVFRKSPDSDESALVSPPEFTYRKSSDSPTLSMGITTLDASATDVKGDSIALNQTASEDHYPHRGLPNPLSGDDTVTITIESEQYRAWGDFFEARTGIAPTYPAANTVQLTLSNPPRPLTAPGPLVSGGSGTVDLRNHVDVDSYDSRDPGDYASQTPGTASVYADSNVDLRGGAEINGDLYSTGNVTLYGPSEVAGTAYHDGALTMSGGSSSVGSDGGSVPPSSMPNVQNYDTTISNNVSEIGRENDNPSEASDITRIENGGCRSTTCTLDEGDYHLNDIDIGNGGTLEFHPNGGTIRVGVSGDVFAGPGASIEVIGDGNVVLYNVGDFELRPRVTVVNAGDDAPQFKVWQHSGSSIDLGSQVVFTGLLHAGPEGDISMNSNSAGHIYGALVGDFTDASVGAGRPLHYDRALRNAHPDGAGAGGSSDEVSYLRISTTEVTIED